MSMVAWSRYGYSYSCHSDYSDCCCWTISADGCTIDSRNNSTRLNSSATAYRYIERIRLLATATRYCCSHSPSIHPLLIANRWRDSLNPICASALPPATFSSENLKTKTQNHVWTTARPSSLARPTFYSFLLLIELTNTSITHCRLSTANLNLSNQSFHRTIIFNSSLLSLNLKISVKIFLYLQL